MTWQRGPVIRCSDVGRRRFLPCDRVQNLDHRYCLRVDVVSSNYVCSPSSSWQYRLSQFFRSAGQKASRRNDDVRNSKTPEKNNEIQKRHVVLTRSRYFARAIIFLCDRNTKWTFYHAHAHTHAHTQQKTRYFTIWLNGFCIRSCLRSFPHLRSIKFE